MLKFEDGVLTNTEGARALFVLIGGKSQEILLCESKHNMPPEHISKALSGFKVHFYNECPGLYCWKIRDVFLTRKP
jgi:hypothetical protein